MASGPDHFRMAEEPLGQAAEVEPGSDIERYCLAAAQVHAALASAAATALATTAGSVTFDLTDPDDRHVLTQALDDYEVKQTGLAADGDNKDKRTGWAATARRFRDRADRVAGG